ncbi:hypothetical protein GCM10010082_05060 [Kushneria pakistanensis]|uniref:AsmA domain-containing protein n=1 Tax=Kushneria pakistanensis TaxID=1508770 RepID=A0ABQ3FBD2_9GAMM|nr:hypothetical protein GCM10010082_05060 [Kushneria pakistanensis]
MVVLGFLLATWGLASYASQKISSSTGQPASIERLIFNPLTATLSLRGLALGDPAEPIATIEQGSVTLRWSSLWEPGLHISDIVLDGAHLHMVTDASGELNLETLGEGTSPDEDSAMRVVIDHIAVSRGQLDWIDRQASPQGQLSLRDMTLSLSDYDSEQPDPMHGSASARLGDGRLEARGDFSPVPLTGDLQLKGEQLALTQLNPWLVRMQHMQIESGVLQGQGRLAFGRAVSDDVLWQGDIDLEALRILDQQGQDVLGLEKAALKELDIQGSDHLRAESIILDAPNILVLLDEQGGLNLTSQPDSDKEQASSSASQGAPSDDGDSGQGVNMALGSLRINNGTFRFEDHQMSPVVQLDIRGVEGHMNAFDTRTSVPAEFTLKGLESDDTPVAIEGSFSAGSSLKGEMSLTSERLPLKRFAPYVRRFGGYRIESGTADLDLHYQLDDGRVTASNHVVLRRLALDEEAVDNDASLPLRRLVGMLQGDDGVINLDIPIQATVDGGEVDIGGVVMQVLGEVLKNLATSPIDTLDAMINGDDNDAADENSEGYTEGPLSQVATEPGDE